MKGREKRAWEAQVEEGKREGYKDGRSGEVGMV